VISFEAKHLEAGISALLDTCCLQVKRRARIILSSNHAQRILKDAAAAAKLDTSSNKRDPAKDDSSKTVKAKKEKKGVGSKQTEQAGDDGDDYSIDWEM